MKASQKALVWILITYATGMASGMLLNGALAQRRDTAMMPDTNAGKPPAGFVQQVELELGLHDSAQAFQLRPFIQAADAKNRAIVDGARGAMRGVMDSLRTAISPMLDDAQRARLEEIGKSPEGGRGRAGRGNGPPGLEVGPPGRGGRMGPPPRDGRGGPPDGAPNHPLPRPGSGQRDPQP